MDFYFYIAVILILSQLVFLNQMRRNYRNALAEHKKKRDTYRPHTVLIVPCKGLEPAFEENIASFFNQDYEDYLLWFVVADKSDPAYARLCELKDRLSRHSKAQDVQILVAGPAQTCSQKVHNLLYCYRQIDKEGRPFRGRFQDGQPVEVLTFADSDACIRSDWLSQIVHYLPDPKIGVASGYRWFVPQKNNLATLALSAVNAKIAQLLGDTHFNQAWGGSMTIRLDVFRRLGVDKIWSKALSDDLSLSYVIKKAGLKIIYVPACLVASYETVTWSELFEFAHRQFLITRVSAPRTWWFGLCGTLYSVLGLWATAALVVYAAMKNFEFRIFRSAPFRRCTCSVFRRSDGPGNIETENG
jgi:ceramide glucosyltransferase